MDRQRRQFLRGRLHHPAPIRPPWARSEQEFIELCTACGDCIKACPQSILCAGDRDFPEVDFRRGACTFCGDCRRACTVAAFHEPSAEADPWTRLARVAAACLEYQGVSCRACGDACEVGAIRFNLHAGGQSLPRIAADTCTGCGACVSVCPVLAITVE